MKSSEASEIEIGFSLHEGLCSAWLWNLFPGPQLHLLSAVVLTGNGNTVTRGPKQLSVLGNRKGRFLLPKSRLLLLTTHVP